MSEDFDEGVDQDVREEEQLPTRPAGRETPPARPAGSETPPARPAEGSAGSRPECPDHLGVVWTDKRPAGPRLDRTILR
jgi:hypothetical protein